MNLIGLIIVIIQFRSMIMLFGGNLHNLERMGTNDVQQVEVIAGALVQCYFIFIFVSIHIFVYTSHKYILYCITYFIFFVVSFGLQMNRLVFRMLETTSIIEKRLVDNSLVNRWTLRTVFGPVWTLDQIDHLCVYNMNNNDRKNK